MVKKISLSAFFFFYSVFMALAQHMPQMVKTGIYVDQQGVMRWEKNDQEATFFGVNYTAPFAYGFRSIQRTGVSVEQAIKDDVYHFSRLGLDAFRVHVWDTEISDAKGNLLDNEHLRLFDFLIAELKKRKIKTLITPIAFWGNGYPEEDIDLGGFSSKYGKKRALVEEEAYVAQERYLTQFFKHKNRYTGLTYQHDPDIIATEINNEPQHSGPAGRATEYINRMVKAIRGTGWTKPVFYNISESPDYAAAAVIADVQGHSFQWYPTGLVAGHTLKGNYLPNVSRYTIPFDSIPGFKNRAKMVYEFDAGDILDSYMYPAMAKSFRVAGFQWATQFAYDPMATAYANTEYQTHFLNLAYTPAKAISLLIAAHTFHDLPRGLKQDSDTTFGAFKVSYATASSEMNSAERFYYSAPTITKPVAEQSLQHIAGVGSSVLLKTDGTGAYFLDKLEKGAWRLEIMPNAVFIGDPFEKTSVDRIVAAINWDKVTMVFSMADLGSDFSVKAVNEGNTLITTARAGVVELQPGTYLITKKGKNSKLNAHSSFANGRLGEFVAPQVTAINRIEKAVSAIKVRQVMYRRDTDPLLLYRPELDQDRLMIYYPDWKKNEMDYLTGSLGFQVYIGDRIQEERKLGTLKTLVIRVKAADKSKAKLKIGLIDVNSNFFSANLQASTNWTDIEVPLSSLKQDYQLVLPRPYPGFLPLYFQSARGAIFDLKKADKLELTKDSGVEVGLIYLK